MGAFVYDTNDGGSSYTIRNRGANGGSEISVEAGDSSVRLNDSGDAWVFSIKAYLFSKTISVKNWQRTGTTHDKSTCTVTLYEGGFSGRVIGSQTEDLINEAMVGNNISSNQVDFEIGGIKGVAQKIYVKIDCYFGGVAGSPDENTYYNVPGIWQSGYSTSTVICTQHAIRTGYFYVGDIQLTQKPVLGNFINTNPYDDKQTISASETSISLSWSKVDGDDATKSQYQLNGQWYDCDSAYSTTISGLQPGTTYTIAVSGYNEAGWSDYIYITVRTRYSPPVLSVIHNHNDDAGLEDLIFHWTSNTDIKKICYKINGSQLVNLTASGKSGQFKVNTCEVGDGIGRTGLFPNTIYAVDVYIISIDEYDHLDSNTVDLDTITDDIAHITEAPSFNLSDNITLKKTNESGNKNEVILYINGDNDRHNSDIIMIDKDMPNETLPVDFTQEMIDTMYHQFGLKNDIASRALIKTFSIYDTNRFYSANTEGRVTLTGVMKTIHSNEHYSTTSNERIYRGQIWYNPGDGPVRAVGWANVELDGKDTLLRSI